MTDIRTERGCSSRRGERAQASGQLMPISTADGRTDKALFRGCSLSSGREGSRHAAVRLGKLE